MTITIFLGIAALVLLIILVCTVFYSAGIVRELQEEADTYRATAEQLQRMYDDLKRKVA